MGRRSRFDVIVVGGGHAGVEAAVAAARMGARTAMVTLSRSMIGEMPCNPAVGGVGKGHLVAELDALGGVQGWAADRSGIQFRVLNRSRGPAVWGPRAQCDKVQYARSLQRLVRGIRGLEVVEGEVEGLLVGDRRVEGVLLAGGGRLEGGAVVVATGTFLSGRLHRGLASEAGGRAGERAAERLGGELSLLGLRLRRFKTGTPPRLRRSSLRLEDAEIQEGDAAPRAFSWRSRSVRNRVCCWMVQTPPVVREIIGENLESSPLYSGLIRGVGPRYCPSIEDKVVRFPQHERHTLFLEPEGVSSESIYVNGLSTSLPSEVQDAVIRVIPGLERAEVLRYGYAVEYDVVAPGQVRGTLEAVDMPGLYLAGQVLGTSGYEEAAALGLVAGVNAVMETRGDEPLVIGREEGYIGVLVDDLMARDHDEPYRMLTSRAEHRLVLGVDSARERLMARGVALGLVPERVFHVEHERWADMRAAAEILEGTAVRPDRETCEMLESECGVRLRSSTTWAGLLRRQDVDLSAVAGLAPGLKELSSEESEVVVGRARYRGYIDRHIREQDRLQRLARARIPESLDPASVSGLSREVVEQLRRYRPRTLAEAERVPGVTAAAMAILAGCIARREGMSR